MALQGIDACDLYGDYNDIERRYPASGVPNALTVHSTAGRNGGGAISANNANTYIRIPVTGTPTTYYFAAAIKERVVYDLDRNFLTFTNASGTIITVKLVSGNLIEGYRGTSTFLGASTLPACVVGGYWALEVKVVVHASAGSIEIRRKGETTPILNITGANTEGFSGGIETIGLWMGDGQGSCYIDDFYHYDTTGSGVTDFLGDREMETRRPNGDASVQFTRSGGAANFEMVDDDPESDDDGTYNESGTVGFIDRFNLQDMAVTPVSVDAVQVVVVDRKTAAGASQGKVGVYSGATEGLGAAEGLGTAYGVQTHLLELNPDDAAAWEETDVNALQLQVEHA